MHRARIAIVGGGLAGLYAAWLLQRQGCQDWVLIEARERAGGRILCVPALQGVDAPTEGAAEVPRLDLGPSWFWPDYQPQLDQLVHELGLRRFEQFEQGDMVVERAAGEAPVRARGYLNTPPSMRLVGGMGSLTDALHQRLDASRVLLGHAVRGLRSVPAGVEIDLEGGANWCVEHVLLALPPRLAASTLGFEPALPPGLARQWLRTDTWMAPHAKYFAVYEQPFWREQGLSGEARSALGPLVEIHDASLPGGRAAVFGFLGVPARVRKGLAPEVLRTHCRAQLARLFGPQAGAPAAEFLQDWALEPYTATTADGDASGQHAQAPAAAPSEGSWSGRLIGIGSEWSPQFPGYLAGAVDAAGRGVRALGAGVVAGVAS